MASKWTSSICVSRISMENILELRVAIFPQIRIDCRKGMSEPSDMPTNTYYPHVYIFLHTAQKHFMYFWQSTFCRVVVTKFTIYAQMLMLHAHAAKLKKGQLERNEQEKKHLPFAFQNHIRIKAFGRSAVSLFTLHPVLKKQFYFRDVCSRSEALNARISFFGSFFFFACRIHSKMKCMLAIETKRANEN